MMMEGDEPDDTPRDRAEKFLKDLSRRRMTMVVGKDGKSRTVGEVLADLAVDALLPANLRRRVKNGPLTAIVTVPTAQWIDPIVDAIRELAGEDSRVSMVGRDKVQKDRDMPTLMDWIAEGRPVLGVSHIPDAALPPLLLNVSELRLVVPRLDAAMALAVMRRVLKGRIPPEAASLDYSILDFQEFCALLPANGNARTAVDRIAAVIRSKAKVGTRTDKLPKLEAAVEYGEARLWALNLRDDLRDLRLNLIEAKDVDKGAILFGPPGTGKSLLARMIGEACGIPTIVASMGELFAGSSGYLDAMIKAQRSLFQEAMSKAPSILFLDEINSYPRIDQLGRRNKDYWLPLLTDFYTLLDGSLSDRAGVVVIGATNAIEDISPAILRPGRLERSIYVGPPNASGAERILRHHLADDLRDVDLGRLAAIAAAGRSTGAVLEERVRAARRTARRAGRTMSSADLEEQVAPPDPRPEADVRRVAIHESGHALAVHLLGIGEMRSASVVDDGSAGGAIEFTGTSGLLTKAQTYAHAKCLLAGRAAEMVMLGEASHGAGGSDDSDLAQATRMIGMAFMSTGLEDSLVYRGNGDKLGEVIAYDAELRRRIDEVLHGLLDAIHALLAANRPALERLSNALVERRFLDGPEIKKVLDDVQLLKTTESAMTKTQLSADASASGHLSDGQARTDIGVAPDVG